MSPRYKNYLEIFSTLFSILPLYLGANQYILHWPLSILVSLANLLIYFYKGLYASLFQNILCIMISLYGWYAWHYGGQNRTELTIITRTPLSTAGWLLIAGLLYIVAINAILTHLDGATFRFVDSLRSALTMVGMWLTSHKKLETYLVWFVVNVISIAIFYQKESYFLSMKYLFFLVFSIYSYRLWYHQYSAQLKGASGA